MKIAVIACSNGLGHIKRDIKIINQIRTSITVKVDLFCESWQIERLYKWSDLLSFKNSENSRIFKHSFPLKWSTKPDYYGKWLLNWHDFMNKWDLDQYDLVFSDNYIEPLVFTKNVLLGGSFLWHDILGSYFQNNKEVLDYYEWGTKLLKYRNPSMIVNKYFVMNSVLSQVNPCKVGLIHFDSRQNQKKEINNPGKNILIALGNAEQEENHVRQIQELVDLGKDFNYCFYCNENLRDLIHGCLVISDNFFYSSDISKVDFAIIRGGIGTISDCIASRIPMMFIHDENPEIEHNQKCLIKMNIGIPMSSFNDPNISPLINREQYKTMQNNFSQFDLNGVKEAADVVKTKLLG